MPSIKQLEANRRNAQRSTGPRTAESKGVSRTNALGGGIYADREVVLPFEDPEALVALAKEYYERFDPATPEERCLVDSLVSDEWLLRRFRRIEGEMMTRFCAEVKGQGRFAMADAYEDNSTALDRLQRRINATRRFYLKALETLRTFQKEQQKREEALAPTIEKPRPLPEPIGFAPQPPAAIPNEVAPADTSSAVPAPSRPETAPPSSQPPDLPGPVAPSAAVSPQPSAVPAPMPPLEDRSPSGTSAVPPPASAY